MNVHEGPEVSLPGGDKIKNTLQSVNAQSGSPLALRLLDWSRLVWKSYMGFTTQSADAIMLSYARCFTDSCGNDESDKESVDKGRSMNPDPTTTWNGLLPDCPKLSLFPYWLHTFFDDMSCNKFRCEVFVLDSKSCARKKMVPIAFAFQLNHWKQVPSTLYDISGQSGNRVSVVLNQKHSVGRHGLLRLGENMAFDFNWPFEHYVMYRQHVVWCAN